MIWTKRRPVFTTPWGLGCHCGILQSCEHIFLLALYFIHDDNLRSTCLLDIFERPSVLVWSLKHHNFSSFFDHEVDHSGTVKSHAQVKMELELVQRGNLNGIHENRL